MNKILLALAGVATAAAVAAGASASGGGLLLGPTSHTSQPTFKGYYDGHKDTYLITDVSSKAQAAALHVNYSAALARFKGAPEQYFVRGRAAAGQLAVFGSEPGEASYNPLWAEVFLAWKPGVKPVVIVSDTQIDTLEKAGKLTEKDAHIVLNAPITKVGK